MKSIYAYYRQEKINRIETSAKESTRQDDADFENVLKINNEWNQTVAKLREVRLAKEHREMAEQIRKNLEEQKEYEEEQRRITNEIVLREKVTF